MAGKWARHVVCPFQCGHTSTRSNLYTHLKTRKHAEDIERLTPEQVATLVRQAVEVPELQQTRPVGRPRKTEEAKPAGAKPVATIDRIVECSFPGCESTYQRGNAVRHMRVVHAVGSDRAKALAAQTRTVVASSATESPSVSTEAPAMVPAIVELERRTIHGVHVEHDAPDPQMIDPADIAIAVVQSQVNGSGLAVDLLPEFINYVDATRAIVFRIREHVSTDEV